MTMTEKWQLLAQRLATPKFRLGVHFGTIMLSAIVLSIFPIELDIAGLGLAEDKALHFEGGQWIGTTIFHAGYIALAIKMLLFGKGPITPRLLWLPTAFFFLGGLSLLVVSIVAGGKELLDSMGMGVVEWADFVATFDGGFMPNIQSALLLLAVTPALIPMDMLLQWPEKILQGSDTGHEDMNEYLAAKKNHEKVKVTQVLLIEDDLACASLALKFCQKCGLSCRHVDTLKDAMGAFVETYPHLKLVILDLYVRVEDANDRRTGADWLAKIHQKFPKGNRSFIVVVTTGHPEQLGEKAELADLVLGKPWDPKKFKGFLAEQKVINA
jgi:CheY-like chemotaxis protein